MIGFFVKKSFFDGWDNLLPLLLLNLGHIVPPLAILAVWGYVKSLPLIILLTALALLVWSIYSAGVSGAVLKFAAYGRGDWSSFSSAIKTRFGHCLLHFVATGLGLTCVLVGIPFYLQTLGGLLGLTLAASMFWLALFSGLAMQYFFPLAQTFTKDGPLKTLKKSFIVMAGNFGFSIFLALHVVFDLALSLAMALMMPGLAAVQLSQAVALRLLLLKYDYIEAHPEMGPKKMKRPPWGEILVKEKEMVGHRTLKGMIFPWKE